VSTRQKFELTTEWVGITHTEITQGQETYGYVEPNRVALEGVRFLPKDRPSDTLMMYMHPTATISRLPVPRAMAEAGVHVLCAESRYTRNDTALIMEKVLLDYGAFVRHAKEVWGYEKVVLAGWSGGGSLTSYYQSQAENPTVVETPAGDPVELGQLIGGDGFVFHAAHLSRAEMLADFIDPSVLDEANPDVRNPELDLYDPRNPNKPPYTADYLQYFRAQQKARVRRRTAYVKELLEQLRLRGGAETDRVILTHRTMADPRCLDPAIDPNDRKPGTSLMGDPEASNVNPAGIARYCTLRSWLSQWSLDDSRAQAAVAAANITIPVLVIENSADHIVPQPHSERFFSACASKDKTFFIAKGADHYYRDDTTSLESVVDETIGWMTSRNLLLD
jgi:pimeloyl-ACP methyl ester carboxylesterase